MLTAQQLAHFDTFGFVVVRQLFTPQEVASIGEDFDDLLAEERGRLPFDGKERQAIQPFVERREALTALLDDDRLYRLHEDLLGPGFRWIGSDGNLYVGDTAWHSDREGDDVEYRYTRIKTTLYLDPVTKDSGCLRLIPGSHKRELHESLTPLGKQHEDAGAPSYGVSGADIPGFPIESRPGDVVVFNQVCWHSSFGGHAGRRMLALSLIAAPSADEHVAYLRKTHAKMRFGYRPTRSWVNSDRPRIRGMVATLLELGFETQDV